MFSICPCLIIKSWKEPIIYHKESILKQFLINSDSYIFGNWPNATFSPAISRNNDIQRTWALRRWEKKKQNRILRCAQDGTRLLRADILYLTDACSILRQSSYPVCGLWKNQASSLWAKRHRAYPVPSMRNQIQGWMTVLICYCHPLQKVCLLASHRRGRRTTNGPISK